MNNDAWAVLMAAACCEYLRLCVDVCMNCVRLCSLKACVDICAKFLLDVNFHFF